MYTKSLMIKTMKNQLFLILLFFFLSCNQVDKTKVCIERIEKKDAFGVGIGSMKYKLRIYDKSILEKIVNFRGIYIKDISSYADETNMSSIENINDSILILTVLSNSFVSIPAENRKNLYQKLLNVTSIKIITKKNEEIYITSCK